MIISDFIGQPYDHPRFNCWSLVHDVLQKVYEVLPPQYHYDGDVMNANEVFVNKIPCWEKLDAPIPSAVVVFNIGGKPLHCGVMINDKEFLHTMKGRDSCIERLDSMQWQRRINGFYLWRN